MSKELTAFRLAKDLMDAMRAVKTKEGIPVTVQIDFAVRAWLKRKGVTIHPERPRRTRKRA
jgi:hypothetical protein